MIYNCRQEQTFLCTKLIAEQYRPAKYWVDCTQSICEDGFVRYEMTLTKWMIHHIDELMKFIRGHHPKGEQYYQTLYYFYVFERKLNIAMICNRVGINTIGQPLSKATVYRWRKQALEVLRDCLWENSSQYPKQYFEFLELHTSPMQLSCVSELRMSYPQ